MADLRTALDRFSQVRVLLIGDFVLDTYIEGDTGRVSREAPVIVVRKQRAEYRLGGAANVAANLAAVGAQCTLAGMVGPGTDGDRLISMLAKVGAEVSGLVRGDVVTPVKTRVLASAVGTMRQQVLRIDAEPEGPLTRPQAGEVAEVMRRRAEDCDVVIVSDYGLGTLAHDVLTAVGDLAAAGKTICVDSRHNLSAYYGVTAVTPNVPEAAAEVDFSLTNPARIADAGKRIAAKLNTMCLLTQGRGGMGLFRADGTNDQIPIVGQGEVTDVTGAGDTVIGTFATALGAGFGAANAMRLANCAAGVVVSRYGAATASLDEIAAQVERFDVELEPWGEL